ncbi:hypothetical protein CHLNCDRAFT_25863, partial [Chlorella variabilis]
NVITFSSLISACERSGRCDLALRLFDEMRREGCRPNVVTYNGLIGACAQAGMWAKAAEVFDSMIGGGVRPDAVTFSVLVAAYERGGQWRRCLQAFEQMQQQGFRPDACVYNVVSWSWGLRQGGWLQLSGARPGTAPGGGGALGRLRGAAGRRLGSRRVPRSGSGLL